MKRFMAAEMDYGPNEVEALRGELITLRDDALKAAEFGPAVIISHAIALLAVVKKEIWKDDIGGNNRDGNLGGDPDSDPIKSVEVKHFTDMSYEERFEYLKQEMAAFRILKAPKFPDSPTYKLIENMWTYVHQLRAEVEELYGK